MRRQHKLHFQTIMRSVQFVVLVSLLLAESTAFADSQSKVPYAPVAPYTQVTEAAAKSSVVVGMTEQQVQDKVGTPNIIDCPDGTRVLQYVVNPARKDTGNYAGFEVFLKNNKVTFLGITHRSLK
jgi:outer membrane protein assembly factor BamE (lipoprotein component of BamABCDE complex)